MHYTAQGPEGWPLCSGFHSGEEKGAGEEKEAEEEKYIRGRRGRCEVVVVSECVGLVPLRRLALALANHSG